MRGRNLVDYASQVGFVDVFPLRNKMLCGVNTRQKRWLGLALASNIGERGEYRYPPLGVLMRKGKFNYSTGMLMSSGRLRRPVLRARQTSVGVSVVGGGHAGVACRLVGEVPQDPCLLWFRTGLLRL